MGWRAAPGPRRNQFTRERFLQFLVDRLPLERSTIKYKKWLKEHRYRNSDKRAIHWILAEREVGKRSVVYRLDTVYQQFVRYRRSIAR